MSFNITDEQKDLLRWLVQAYRDGHFDDELGVSWGSHGFVMLSGCKGSPEEHPVLKKRSAFDALAYEDLLHTRPQMHGGIFLSITQRGFDAVDSDFDAAEEAGLRLLGPVPSLENLNEELLKRCIPTIAQGNSPSAWDAAIRTAFTVLEERLRSLCEAQGKETGAQLANLLFGKSGALAPQLDDSDREAHRSLYYGAFALVRNAYAHRNIDPEPDEGAELMLFVNLLLRRLDALEAKLTSREAPAT